MKPPSHQSSVISPKTLIYVRGSTTEQQNTLRAQEDQARAYAKFRELEVVHVAVDEGESAVATDFLERPVVADMLERAQAAGASSLIITKLDRGFRSAVDLLGTIELLEGRGIGIHILDLGLDPTTPVGKMVATILAAIAKFECERRSERQKEAFEAMRKAGQRTGAVPYGWDAVPSTRVSKTGRQGEDLAPNVFEQPILARLLHGDLSAAHVSQNEAARQLNAAGIRTKTGKQWHGATVDCIRKSGRLAPGYERKAA